MVVKKIIISLSLVASFAVQAEELASRSYDFYPQQPVSLENPLIWSLEARCTMSTDGEHVLSGTMKRKSGSINGQRLKQGQSTFVLVHNKDEIQIAADARAKIEITNNGTTKVRATCRI